MPRTNVPHPEEHPEGVRLEGRNVPLRLEEAVSIEVSIHGNAWLAACPEAEMLVATAAHAALDRAAGP